MEISFDDFTKIDIRVGTIRRETECEGRRAYGVEVVSACSEDRATQQWLYAHAMGA